MNDTSSTTTEYQHHEYDEELLVTLHHFHFWICTVQISQAAAAYHNTIKSLTYVYRSCIAGRATSRVSGRLKAMACALESSRI